MLEKIRYSSDILLKNFPINWISKIELYYPDLPGFPIVYVHKNIGKQRVYGFPLSASYRYKSDMLCDIQIKFFCNKDLERDQVAKDLVTQELKERFGMSKKFGMEDVLASCNSNKKYKEFFKKLMDYTFPLHGESIPYGAFYEEVYSIIRFVSAWNPKTGRQSEMRMLYNFLSIFGEKIEMKDEWKFIEFYLLPTYDDILAKNFLEFGEFNVLFSSMEKIWLEYYTVQKNVNGTTLRFMERAWPTNKGEFIQKVTATLRKKGLISSKERQSLERLVDAFNRHPRRTAYFIWSIMTAFDKDYRTWDKEFYREIVLLTNTKGYSPKVVSCFLQQGFNKEEIIPIDTWIESFFKLALGIDSKREFIDSFSMMGKLERLIWLACQAKKTNNRHLIDTLWCIRFGVRGNKELRGPNPIACYECFLRKECPSYARIKNDKVFLIDMNKQKPEKDLDEAVKDSCKFVCELDDNGIPRKVMKFKPKSKVKWIDVDEFSGYLLEETHRIKNPKKIMMVDSMISSMPRFNGADFRKSISDIDVDEDDNSLS